MQKCSCKCYSLNGNTPGRVVLPGASRSKEEMGGRVGKRREEGVDILFSILISTILK